MPALVRPQPRAAVRTLVSVLLLASLASGCSGEEGPVDDGSYSSVQAGADAALAEVGVKLLATDLPGGVDAAVVAAALSGVDLATTTGSRADGDGLALDPAEVAGLIATVGNQAGARSSGQRYVVLVFDDPASAILFARSAPAVFDDREADEARQGYVAGRLVGYYAPGQEVDETRAFADALTRLAEPAAGFAEPTEGRTS